MNSIRRQLLLWQVGSVVVTGLLLSAVTYQLAWHGFNRVRDYGLEQIAHSVLRHGVRAPAARRSTAPPLEAAVPASAGSGTTDDASAPDEGDEAQEEDLGQFVSQIWQLEPDGTAVLLYASVDGGGPPLQPDGLHLVDWGDERWRVFRVAERQQAVQVAVTEANRISAFLDLVPWLLLPLAALVGVLGTLIHLAVGRALAPLERVRGEIERRDPGALHPLPTGGLPDELEPLVQALNALMARSDALLDSQRRFVADAAHALNTPLAAVRLQAQLVARADDTERPARLAELADGITRATHLVRQLLQLARMEPGVGADELQLLPLDEAAGRVVAAFDARAQQQGLDLGLEVAPGTDAAALRLCASPQALQLLLENLVDNALRHAPHGSAVDLRLSRAGPRVVLEVVDHGPGIPAGERAQALQRFVRLRSAQGEGSGLGLAIVASIVAQSSADLFLQDTAGGGLTVRVSWPAASVAETKKVSAPTLYGATCRPGCEPANRQAGC